jgi:hypothetical protein
MSADGKRRFLKYTINPLVIHHQMEEAERRYDAMTRQPRLRIECVVEDADRDMLTELAALLVETVNPRAAHESYATATATAAGHTKDNIIVIVEKLEMTTGFRMRVTAVSSVDVSALNRLVMPFRIIMRVSLPSGPKNYRVCGCELKRPVDYSRRC